MVTKRMNKSLSPLTLLENRPIEHYLLDNQPTFYLYQHQQLDYYEQ
jgi:hypothetical protein